MADAGHVFWTGLQRHISLLPEMCKRLGLLPRQVLQRRLPEGQVSDEAGLSSPELGHRCACAIDQTIGEDHERELRDLRRRIRRGSRCVRGSDRPIAEPGSRPGASTVIEWLNDVRLIGTR